jgi:2-methylcitrate dehydratase PrpD
MFGCCLAPDQLSAGLGTSWLILQNFQKIYPCCQYAHSTIEAMADLMAALPPPLAPGEATEIAVDIHPKGLKLNQYDPPTMLSARFSVPHIAAVMAARGRIDSETLAPGSLADPVVAMLRRRVVLRPYSPDLPPPDDRAARVTLKFEDGREFTAECLCARGSPSKPLGQEAIRRKIAAICTPVYPELPAVFARMARLEEAALQAPWRGLIAGSISQRTR